MSSEDYSEMFDVICGQCVPALELEDVGEWFKYRRAPASRPLYVHLSKLVAVTSRELAPKPGEPRRITKFHISESDEASYVIYQ